MEAACREDRGDAILAEIATHGDFPAAMQAIARLRRVIERDDCTSLALAHVILQDAGLSSKVLRVVNSAFYQTGGVPVSTITRAILLLGFDRISDLATGLLLLEQFTGKGAHRDFLREHLRRSLRCGIVAQALSRCGGASLPEEAYLLGMFSNLGTLWLATYYPDDLDAAARRFQSGAAATIEEALTGVLGVSPAAIAARVADEWQLPATYASHFRRQANARPGEAGPEPEEISAVVELADAYARTADVQPIPSQPLLDRQAEHFALSAEQALALLQRPEADFRRDVRALGLELVGAPSAATLTRRGALHADPAGRPLERNDVKAIGDGGAAVAADGRRAPITAELGERDAPADRSLALEIIAEITDSIRAGNEIGSVLGAILEGIARSGSFDAVVLWLVGRERDRLTARLGYGSGVEQELESLSVPLAPGAGLLAEVVQSRASRLVRMGQPRLLVAAGATPPRLPASSFAIEPLVLRDRAVGAILASRGGPPAVGEPQAALVRLFANLACIALSEVGRRNPPDPAPTIPRRPT